MNEITDVLKPYRHTIFICVCVVISVHKLLQYSTVCKCKCYIASTTSIPMNINIILTLVSKIVQLSN